MSIYLIILSFFLSEVLIPDTLINPDLTFGNFENAESISASRDEFLFISDVNSNIVYKYNNKGELLLKIGGSGLNENQFSNPTAIDAKNGLDVFITDCNNNKIQRYDINLNFLTLIDFNNYNLTSDISSKIYYPIGITVLPSSDIFIITQTGEYKLFKIKNFSSIVNFYGNNFGQEMLKKPSKIVTDNINNIYILDIEQNAIIVYDIIGNFISKLDFKKEKTLVNISYYNSKLLIMSASEILVYDVNKRKYMVEFSFKIENPLESPKGIELIKNNDIFLLSSKKVYKYNLNIN